ncbi:MAG: hypothetical protein JRG74_15535 [Deltaproteobacteria bacterium]|nr:hypothetical protein [Deltaproteobacteria bacterium]MBW2570712.1 hypothetical protein [Deltaproteobacteria bacterium]
MKKFILLIATIAFFICPSICFSSYLVELKNGSTFIINHYWKEGRQIKFYYYGGVVGIEKEFVKTIRESDIAYKEEIDSKKKRIDLESEINEKPKMTGTVDLEYYKEKKSLLEAELNRTLDRLREATKNKDSKAKKKARDEVKKISAKMYDLTAELIKKNNGKMPEGWWEKK